MEYLHRPPTWTPPSANHFILPGLLGAELSLDEAIPYLERLPTIPAADAITLLRGARQYRDALWLGDSDPHLAWLLLVSAVESCASYHAMANVSPTETLASAKPTYLVAQLEAAGGAPQLVEDMAGHLAGPLGATGKFIRFIKEFRARSPDSPTRIQPSRLDPARQGGEHRVRPPVPKAFYEADADPGPSVPATACIRQTAFPANDRWGLAVRQGRRPGSRKTCRCTCTLLPT